MNQRCKRKLENDFESRFAKHIIKIFVKQFEIEQIFDEK